MTDRVGSEIAKAADAASAAGIVFQQTREANVCSYVREAEHHRIELTVDRGFIGMAVLARANDGSSVTYEFDSDLYDISSEKYREFGATLEADVLEFLRQLVKQGVLVGIIDSSLTMIVPQSAHVTVVTRGRFLTKTTRIDPDELSPDQRALLPIQDWAGRAT